MSTINRNKTLDLTSVALVQMKKAQELEDAKLLANELEKAKAEAEQYKTESELYKQKYIDRFMTADDKAPQPKPAPAIDLQEKNVIDIKEI